MNTNDIDSASTKSQFNWKDLLESYIKENELTEQMIEEQEKKANDEFIEMIKVVDNNNSSLPKFFFKKQITYSDLSYSVKLEAKSRFLQLKSFEIPSKKRKILTIKYKFFICRFKRPLARAKIKAKPLSTPGRDRKDQLQRF